MVVGNDNLTSDTYACAFRIDNGTVNVYALENDKESESKFRWSAHDFTKVTGRSGEPPGEPVV